VTASRPEADFEYSRGHRTRRGDSEDSELRWQRRFETHRNAVLAVGLLGAALLLMSELTPATGLSTATSSPAIGLFLETGGGAVLILSAAAGMLLEPVPDVQPRGDSRAGASPTRSAS
jgi:hypothetical protein